MIQIENSYNPIAVIDVGSNSVRLVIYDGLKRAPVPIFNEKVLCGLAIGISGTGKLNPQGVKAAYACIGRFITLAKVMKVTQLHIFATSAVRDAKDGEAFTHKIESMYGHKIEVVSGVEEAKYGGYGIMASMVHARGIMADLGGGSLELIGVEDDLLATNAVSYPIGPLRISGHRCNMRSYQDMVQESLHSFDFSTYKGQAVYLVGGAFRNLAKIHMERKRYPLKVIHGYSLTPVECKQTLQLVARMSEQALQDMGDIPEKRAKFLPFAAIILSQLIESASPKQLIFSACGAREGLLFSKLPEAEKRKDVLIEGCVNQANMAGSDTEYGFELARWLAPLFPDADAERVRLMLAACILSDIACYEHTEYRAEMAYRRIMDSSLMGITHSERTYIAQILYYRYDASVLDGLLTQSILALLKKPELHHAKIVGTAMRLARSLSGSHIGVLPHVLLSATKDKVILTFKEGYQPLYGEKIARRLAQLAGVLNVKPVVRK